MLNVPYERFVSSKPFLIVGPGRQLFYAHGTLLSECSPVLRKDVLGGMQETQLQTIEIQDVEGDIDDDTVMRFIEYAYTGDYTVPGPDIVQLPSDSKDLQEAFVSTSTPAINGDGWNSGSASSKSKMMKKEKKKKRTTVLDDHLESELTTHYEEAAMVEDSDIQLEPEALTVYENPAPAIYTVDSDRQNLWTSFSAEIYTEPRPVWKPRNNNDEREDYTSIFLCHARLYKFSDRYGCDELMAMTVERLRLTLSSYTFYPLRASNVVELVRYTYAHTIDASSPKDKLRAIVLRYVVCYFRELMNDTSFHELLQEGGSLPLELMIELAKIVA